MKISFAAAPIPRRASFTIHPQKRLLTINCQPDDTEKPTLVLDVRLEGQIWSGFASTDAVVLLSGFNKSLCCVCKLVRKGKVRLCWLVGWLVGGKFTQNNCTRELLLVFHRLAELGSLNHHLSFIEPSLSFVTRLWISAVPFLYSHP